MGLTKLLYIIATTFICLVWFINGLLCKVLTLVPRHQEIVSRILGAEYAWLFTKAIGVAEILMVVWIVSRIQRRFCSLFQIAVVATMNIMEFILVPDLLLFGRMNIVFASLFIGLIYVNEFILSGSKQLKIKQELNA
ncbi:hypothetical protein KK083_04185 [Fulvivirgaceae bacterium PWU4]|uniref:DoxX family protein n=1 Tax=Chryseosolibacter histidini TaxID=2782349 RepID=A0AAP2DIX6_9BACT|nr:DoxX-like family protein [Chryseosolibacter histidini]MBT1696062.1 hypothetical protein [Chryseosolibacter histidini]